MLSSQDQFTKDTLRFGCLRVLDVLLRSLRTSPNQLQGFRHFTLYLRGREEMLVTVLSNPTTPEENRNPDR